jgi:transcriptional antiterminator RfaH
MNHVTTVDPHPPPAAEPQVHPRAEAGPLAGLSGQWWILHTRARNEKKVAEMLATRGIGFYLPLVSVRRTYEKRKTTFQIPLFPGYVFLCGDREACLAAWKTNRVAQILEVSDQDGLRRELESIAVAVEFGAALELYPALQPGRRCRVTRGPLKDVEGTVLRKGTRAQMFLAVTLLGQSAVVEVDAALLEPIGDD